MSELTQKLKNQGWTNSCDCRYALHLHCHNQILKSADEIDCQNCDKEMSFDAHIYEHDFGKNNAMLRSVYICDSCQQNINSILYEGVSRALDDLV